MDDKEKEITYQQDKAAFVKKCFADWQGWFKQFEARIKENVQLANNYSEVLARRKAQKIKKASFFFPMISPTLLARAAYQKQMIFQIPEPIKVKPKKNTGIDKAENVQKLVHNFFKHDELKDRLWLEMKLMQEQFPIGFLKISEHIEEETGLSIQEATSSEIVEGTEIPTGREKRFEVMRKEWRPRADLLFPHQVFYDPSPSTWEAKSYIGTVTGLTTQEIFERKANGRYTESFTKTELDEKGEHMEGYDFLDSIYMSMGDASFQSKKGVVSTLWKVKEMFHVVPEEKGEEIEYRTKITTVCGDLVLRDDDWVYEKLKPHDLFIPVVGYPVLGRLEGASTTDMMKYLQHVVNDIFNITLDVARYGLFPPRLRDSRCTILNERIIDAGIEWEIDMTSMPPGASIRDVTMQMFDITPTNKDFFALLNVLLERAEIISSSPTDILMGTSTDPTEKATKTERRWQAVNTRMQGISLLNDAWILRKLAYAFWCMTLEKLQVGEEGGEKIEIEDLDAGFSLEDINGLFAFSVPHIEGLSQREADATKMQNLLVTLGAMPFAKDPSMFPVIYKIFYKLCELQMIPGLKELLPPELEFAGQGGGLPPPLDQLLALMQRQREAGGAYAERET
jgi:hypothetical protein